MLIQKNEYSALVQDYMAMSNVDLMSDAEVVLRKFDTELASMTKFEIACEMARYELNTYFK